MQQPSNPHPRPALPQRRPSPPAGHRPQAQTPRQTATAPRPPAPSSVPENAEAAAAMLARLPLTPSRCRFVLALILRAHNWSHQRKDKGVSHKTMAERSRFCFWLFEFLRRCPEGYQLDPRSFSGRHVQAVTSHWRAEAQAGRLSPATLQTYFSFLKTFTHWIGKPRLLQPIERYFPDPAQYQRAYAAQQDKSWRGKGVDVEPLIAQVSAFDPHAGMSLRLMQCFSLRFKESVMFRPHQDVLSSAQAARLAAGPGRQDLDPTLQHLLVHRGSKGGRPRLFPIDTPKRQAVVEQARLLVNSPESSLGHPGLTLVQALRRLRYCMERFGITRADLGVVPHGLRHQGAADDYRAMTGEMPPVAGGQPVERELDAAARERVSLRLGHNRPAISSAYLGGVRGTTSPSHVGHTAAESDASRTG